MPRIFDAVYGYVDLDEIEFKLVTSPMFQRLHWIKQLGPLHTVFPSAQHSRFSHTIGVFYIIKKMINHLGKRFSVDKSKYEFREEEKILKFAALLHDIGHVPLSHVGEEVLKDTAEEDLSQEIGPTENEREVDIPSKEPSWWRLFPERRYRGGSTKLHERLSAEIVLHNEEIDNILSEVWKVPEQLKEAKKKIAQIIVGTDETDVPTLLLHSELDADRLDYLLRDSFFTGVGYGHIDLDYIISRFAIFSDEDGVADLCVENKGLHTIEHYILGRFFLQTQVIFNRKVRFMDLLFSDVMKYMVKNKGLGNCGLMNLAKFRDHIRNEDGNLRQNLHAIYAYTDAQVFTKMREVHEKLDEKETNKTADEEELYINDCIKIIMDGKVSEPVYTCQKCIDLKENEGYKNKLQNEANQIAEKVAEELDGVYNKRIKANVVEQELMKFNKRMDVDGKGSEETNSGAVKIMYKKPEGEKKKIFAAESNATILDGLTDKALVIFNVYYVPSKRTESPEDIEEKEKDIRQAYSKFVSKYFQDNKKLN